MKKIKTGLYSLNSPVQNRVIQVRVYLKPIQMRYSKLNLAKVWKFGCFIYLIAKQRY